LKINEAVPPKSFTLTSAGCARSGHAREAQQLVRLHHCSSIIIPDHASSRRIQKSYLVRTTDNKKRRGPSYTARATSLTLKYSELSTLSLFILTLISVYCQNRNIFQLTQWDLNLETSWFAIPVIRLWGLAISSLRLEDRRRESSSSTGYPPYRYAKASRNKSQVWRSRGF